MYHERDILILDDARQMMSESNVSPEEILLVLNESDGTIDHNADRATLIKQFDNRVISVGFFCVSSLRGHPASELWCLIYEVKAHNCSLTELSETAN